MRTSHFYAALLTLVALAGCAGLYTSREPLPIAEIVRLSKAGTPPAQINQRIRESRTAYALRGSDFAKLKSAGVQDPVLDYLQQSLVDDLDLLTRYWVLGENLGGCRLCYPQPVDIDAMQSGYGNVSAPSPTRYASGKPPGAPEWVPAYLPPSRQRLSIEQIVDMAKKGTPEAELIDQVKHSRLDNVIGVGAFSAVHTQPIAGLNGSQLGHLREDGLSDAVLDTLQAQFIAQFIEAERLRYQNWGKGPGSML
jgi:hypothetical protein